MSDNQTTVATIVLDHPATAAVFQKHRIDFCCGGNVTLEATCKTRGLDLPTVRAELEAAIAARAATGTEDPRTLSTPALLAFIITKHHQFLRRTFPFVLELAAKVARVHGEREPNLRALAAAVSELQRTLLPHLDREEQVLFPALAAGASNIPEVVDELDNMTRDHLFVSQLLDRIYAASDGFRVPDWGCNSYRTLFAELRTLDGDIREHVHLENHVVLPRFAVRPAQNAAGS
jgi:regulator of cell morphogenesis and NO signaling